MNKGLVKKSILIVVISLGSCKKDSSENPYYVPGEENAGGINTVVLQSSSSFDAPSPALNAGELARHKQGLVFFEGNFVTNPATINGGLGPIFNANGCEACHGKNGSAPFPTIQNDLGGLLFRLSIEGTDAHGGPKDVPGFGGQLQQKAVIGKVPEAQVNWVYDEKTETFTDGQTVILRKPVFSLINPYIPFPAVMFFSPRIAPPVFGLGLLDAISEASILANADETDSNHDGISGKPNYVWDVTANQLMIGKFGWKANQPNLLQQSTQAFHEDMGVTSSMFPVESSWGQSQYDVLTDDPELSSEDIEVAAFYVQSLGAPKRRNAQDNTVLAGKKIFFDAKCNSCHIPKMMTGTDMSAPFNSNQTIFPYTDLLLHDMGDGLADNRSDFSANGNEWRTPPLWGIGLTLVVNGHTNFMHDGRARNLMEAVLWHSGEAEQSKQYIKTLSKKDRDDLITFLNSL